MLAPLTLLSGVVHTFDRLPVVQLGVDDSETTRQLSNQLGDNEISWDRIIRRLILYEITPLGIYSLSGMMYNRKISWRLEAVRFVYRIVWSKICVGGRISETPFAAHSALQWRNNGHDGVSVHEPQDCLLNRLFKRRSKETSKFCVAGLCEGNSPVTGEFPAQKASNAENVSIWWRRQWQATNCCG